MPTVKVLPSKSHEECRLNGKVVIFIACGSDLNKIALYEAFAKEHGLNMFLLETADNVLATRLHNEKLLVHLPIDMTPHPSLVDEVVMTIKEGLASKGLSVNQLDGVVTFWDDAVALTARVATYFGLTTSPPAAIDVSHDKFATRRSLMQAGLPYPKHHMISSPKEIDDIMQDLSYPVVLKPVQGATSIGVYVCNDREEFMENLQEGIRVVEATYEANELMGLVFDDAPGGCAKMADQLKSFVVEEYIDGPEVDIDMIVCDGDVVYAKVSDDWDYQEPWRTETGVNYPSRLPPKMHEEFVDAASQCVTAFGITHGVLHVEMKYSSRNGPMLIEVNPRLGGGPCHFFHKHLYGVDLAVEHVAIAIGLKSEPVVREPTSWGVGLLLYATESGTVTRDASETEEFLQCLESRHVVSLSMPLKAGNILCGWNSPDFPSHAGLLMCSIPRSEMTIEEACDYASSLRTVALGAIKY